MTAYQRVGWARTLMPPTPGEPPRILWVFLWLCGECFGQTFSPAEHRCIPPLTAHKPPIPTDRRPTMATHRYRKKPVEIEARQFTPDADVNEATDGLFAWLDAELQDYWYDDEKNQIIIPTLEGDMRASVGDFIIRGVDGEFYPCKPDIFAATYAAVTDEPKQITIPRPHVAFGPKRTPEHIADADYLREAASHIEGGFPVGGSNLTETVIDLLRATADALHPTTEGTN
ncbi:hypothetical protein [Leifsonia aquatica]|uniref:hypothetical protein n=1 Tax=Leifsonia aquatica TaxID=144185 RepID=UPI003807EDB5